MNEREFRTEDDPKTEQTSESCPDCGAKRGQKHSIGCEWDQCPVYRQSNASSIVTGRTGIE
jgi:hypothetical protein